MKKFILSTFLLLQIANGLLAQNIFGLDVSHYQGTIDWQQVKASGKVFAWAQATQGFTYNDATFVTNITGGTTAGVIMGAYHLARPDNNTAANEAAHFLSIAGSYIGKNYLPPALDLEGVYADKLDIATLTTWIQDWMTAVQTATGIAPVIYIDQTYAAKASFTALTNYKVWIADPDGSSSAAPIFGVWPKWNFKQYSFTGTVSGITGAVDLDVFNGTAQEFNTMIGTEAIQTVALNDISISKLSNCPCETVTLNYTINSPTARDLLLGASIMPTGTTNYLSDATNDLKVSVPIGTSTQSRSFVIPCSVTAGSYDLLCALWLDMNGDGKINAGDVQLTSLQKNNSFSISATLPAQPGTISGNANVCQGTSQTYSITDVAGATSYIWTLPNGWTGSSISNSIIVTPNATSGSISVKAANSCGSSVTASSLSVNATTSVTPTISITQSSCTGSTVSFSSNITNGGTSPTYLWSIVGAGTSSNYTGSVFTVTNATNGTQVQCAITSNAACATSTQVSSNSLLVNCVTTAVSSVNGTEKITIMPNPNNGIFYVQLKVNSIKKVGFKVFNLQGNIIYEMKPENMSGTITKKIELNNISSGIYQMQTIINNESYFTKLFVNKQ